MILVDIYVHMAVDGVRVRDLTVKQCRACDLGGIARSDCS